MCIRIDRLMHGWIDRWLDIHAFYFFCFGKGQTLSLSHNQNNEQREEVCV